MGPFIGTYFFVHSGKISIFVGFTTTTPKYQKTNMDIAASLIKLIFGSKADKDRKQIEPYLEKIKAVYPAIEALSNDELR